MARSKAFVREQSCQVGLVKTTSWQPRPFYEVCDYTRIATILDLPRGQSWDTLHRRLNASPAENSEAA
jgi:hypothetical protein